MLFDIIDLFAHKQQAYLQKIAILSNPDSSRLLDQSILNNLPPSHIR